MNQDEITYSELALKLLEKDINYWCTRYFVPGMELEDLKQECRMRLWAKIGKFRTEDEILVRTWANAVIRNHLKRLLIAAMRQKRGGSISMVGLDDVENMLLSEILSPAVPFNDLDDDTQQKITKKLQLDNEFRENNNLPPIKPEDLGLIL